MKNVRIEELSQSQRELLDLIALNPTGYVTRTAEGSRDMMALAMKGLVADVYETVSGGFSGRLTASGLSLQDSNT